MAHSTVDIEVTVIRQGENAVLVEDSNGTQGWVPHSMIEEDSEIDAESEESDEGTIVIPEWKADELELE